MACYRVEFTATAEKQLKKLPKRERVRVAECIVGLAAEPRPAGSRRLQGYDAVYRVRVGTYRIIYEIYDQKVTVIVLKIGHRKDVDR